MLKYLWTTRQSDRDRYVIMCDSSILLSHFHHFSIIHHKCIIFIILGKMKHTVESEVCYNFCTNNINMKWMHRKGKIHNFTWIGLKIFQFKYCFLWGLNTFWQMFQTVMSNILYVMMKSFVVHNQHAWYAFYLGKN